MRFHDISTNWVARMKTANAKNQYGKPQNKNVKKRLFLKHGNYYYFFLEISLLFSGDVHGKRIQRIQSSDLFLFQERKEEEALRTHSIPSLIRAGGRAALH